MIGGSRRRENPRLGSARVNPLWRRIHPEGIPWPASALYNAVSKTSIFQRHYQLVADDILSSCSPGSLLDIGTGPGWLLVHLHRQRPDAQLAGVDISPAMVSRARENLARAGCLGAIQIRQAAADSLPFPDGSFDTVVSTGSLHHWREPGRGLDEVYRVLKPGGSGLMYDLVKHLPEAVREDGLRRFGRLRMMLLALHSLEEPFYDAEEMRSLASRSLFGAGHTRFVGVLCCLVLQKAEAACGGAQPHGGSLLDGSESDG